MFITYTIWVSNPINLRHGQLNKFLFTKSEILQNYFVNEASNISSGIPNDFSRL